MKLCKIDNKTHDLVMGGGEGLSIRPNKKIPVFRVTRTYLSLLVKHRIFSGFLEKNIIYKLIYEL